MSRLASSLPGVGLRRPPQPRGLKALMAWLQSLLGRFNPSGGSSLLDAVLDSGIDARTTRLAVGAVGVIGFPFYYVVWTYWVPQPYESLPLRLLLAALFVPFLLPAAWLAPMRRHWPWYWHGTLLVAVPFFFSYMALQNDTTAWAMSYVCAVMFTLLMTAPGAGLVLLCTGIALAVAAHFMRHGNADLSGQLIVLAWPVTLFTVVCTLALQWVLIQNKRRRTEALLSVAGFVGHELRTPLATIGMQVEACKGDPEALARCLPTLARETQRANVFIEMLLASVRPVRLQPGGVQCFSQVSIASVVRAAVDRYPYGNEAQRRAVKVRITEDFVVEGVPILLEHLVLNLMKNAFVHGARGHELIIAIRTETHASGNVLVVSDNGHGVCGQDLSRVLERFRSGGTREGALGAGLGLSFCQDVMHSLGGQLDARSSQGAGMQMRLVFPPVHVPQHETAGS
jgi:two-component system CAI-1 autoinducer sensor kinase/phosphatase CqsS